MATTGTMLTFEQFERLPDRPGKSELLRGELIELPPPGYYHDEIAEQFRDLLKAALEEAHARGEALDLGKAHHERGYRLGTDNWVIPDVSVTHAGQRVGKYLEGAPAIAIEVISPGNTAEEMATKTELYFEFGAREVWRVYPKQRHIVVHVGTRATTIMHHETLTTPLIPGFAMPIASILP